MSSIKSNEYPDIQGHQDGEQINGEQQEVCEKRYSILGTHEKYVLVLILSVSSTWSTLSGTIYFPALPQLIRQFSTTSELINISVVVYLISQGLSPLILSFLSDYYGRRPSLIICLLGYCAVCIGISRANTIWLLIFLRALQAATIAPSVAIAFGAVGDVIEKEEKGKFVGVTSGVQNLSQGFGGLLGAGLVTGFGWRGIFVFLAIGSGTCLISTIILFPETNRKLVGNLSVKPGLINKAPILLAPKYKKMLTNDTSTIDYTDIKLKNILAPFRIMLSGNVSLSLVASGLQFATWTISLTSLSQVLESKYGYSTIQVGLCYLAPGLGTLSSSLVSGKLLDWNFKRVMSRQAEGKVSGFPLIKVRLGFAGYSTAIMAAFCVIYGWCLQEKEHIAIIVISLFIMSVGIVSFMTSMFVLLTDLYPSNASALISSMNFVRCLLAALFVGVLDKMTTSMGIGGCYTLMAALCLLSYSLLFCMVFLRK